MSCATTRILVAIAIAGGAAILTTISPLDWRASAQQPKQTAKDYLQRSLEIYEFRQAGHSGAERGGEIFYYKCWFCHNEYTKDIPKLDGMFKRATLLSGEPMSDAAVRAKLRDGGPGMPAYRHTLSDTDLNDLVAYLREKCCWSSDSPPSNPRYRFN